MHTHFSEKEKLILYTWVSNYTIHLTPSSTQVVEEKEASLRSLHTALKPTPKKSTRNVSNLIQGIEYETESVIVTSL